MLTGSQPNVEDSIEVETFEREKGIIYLSGPIREVEDDGRGWREEFKRDYGDEFDILSPLDAFDPSEVSILHSSLDYNPDEEKEQILPVEYITSDKSDIARSEAVFVGLPDVISRGTSMECMFCFMTGTPYYLWEMDSQDESGWITYHADFVHGDRDVVVQEMVSDMEGGYL